MTHASRGRWTGGAALAVAIAFAAPRGWTAEAQQRVALREQLREQLKELSLEELVDVQVTTAAKVPEPLERTPAALFVLTEEDIRLSGARSIPEVLRLVPGVEVARIDANKWSIGVRGFGTRLSKSVLVLIDGRSVYTTLFAGVYWEMHDVLLKDVERIEVVRGPGGTIWGPNAVNGVINIITKSARETRGVFATAGAGNFQQGFGGVRFGGEAGGFSYRAYGKAFSRDAQHHVDGADFDDWQMGQAGFRLDREHERDTFTLQGDIYRANAGNRLAVSTYSPPAIGPVIDDAELAGGNILARWHRALASGGDLQALAYYDRASRTDINFEEDRDTFDVDVLHRFRPAERHNLFWGFGARIISSRPEVVVPTVIWEPNDFTDRLFTGYLQDEITLVDERFWLTLGTKLLHNNYTGFEFQPTARALFQPRERLTFWGAVTRAVRTPSRVDEHLRFTALVQPETPLYLRLTGRDDFSSEYMLGYEAGFRSLPHPDVFVDVAAFHNDYDRLLSVEAQPPIVEETPGPAHLVLPVLLRNFVTGTTSGVEIAPSWTVSSWIRLSGAYSFLNMDLGYEPEANPQTTAEMSEGSSPEHQVVVRSYFALPRDLELGLTYRYVSSLPYREVDAYSTADVTFTWSASPRVQLSLVGRNLFDADHVEFTSDPGPNVGIRRGVYAQITFAN